MLLQKDMFRAHQYKTGWAVKTDEACEVVDYYMSEGWSLPRPFLLLDPHKPTLVPSFDPNSKNENLFQSWHTVT